MGRPKIVEFTGLEDMESLDSRPAKKKNKKQESPVVEAKTNSAETSSETPVETPDQLVEELVEEAASEEASSEIKAEEPAKEVEAPAKPKVGTAKTRSKKHAELALLVEKGKAYPVEELVALLKKTQAVKFDPTVEIHMNMGVDVTKTDQQVRTTTKLPHAIGKAPKILVFGTFKAEEGVAVGDDKTIDTIASTGKVDAKKVIATPEWMPKLSKVAKILGPKGLMPNPKTGTVTTDIAKTVADFKGGLLEIRTEVSGPIIHSRIGKLSLDEEKIKENITAFVDAISKAKPTGVKRNYIKSVYLNTTMGPSIKLDMSSLQA